MLRNEDVKPETADEDFIERVGRFFEGEHGCAAAALRGCRGGER